MRNFILKTPDLLIYLLVFSSVIYLIISYYFLGAVPSAEVLLSLGVVQMITTTIWFLSLNDFVRYEGKSDKNHKRIQTLIWSYFILVSSFIFFRFYSTFWVGVLIALISLILYITLITLLVPKIKNVFYARSKWFIVIELLVLSIGIVTLTPEIKRWSKSDEARKD